jgi:hypothetical protein
MASEKEMELLDDYISNRLTTSERAAFEHRLASDPTLKSELDFQSRIVDSIRQVRKAELKAMLNNVPVPAAPNTVALAGKIALVTLTAGIVASAIYFYLNPAGTTADEPRQPIETQEQKKEPVTAEPYTTPLSVQSQEAPAIANNKESKEPEKTTSSSPPATKKAPVIVQKNPKIEVFDPSTDEQPVNENAAPEEEKTTEVTAGPVTSTLEIQTDNSNRKYHFHYTFQDHKIVLYGNFENHLYDIMEFFNENKRTVFLFYNNNYYLLQEGSKVKPLVPVQDPALLKKLRAYRNQ